MYFILNYLWGGWGGGGGGGGVFLTCGFEFLIQKLSNVLYDIHYNKIIVQDMKIKSIMIEINID